jgi:hypothetical protein
VYGWEQHFILLEDGTIWEWSYERFLERDIYLTISSCIGGTVGFFVGLVLMFVVWLLWRIRLIR